MLFLPLFFRLFGLTCYFLVETAKANKLKPSFYIQHVLKRIADADTLEKLKALSPWNVDLELASKNAAPCDSTSYACCLTPAA
jgi:hypothetical protein